MKEAALRLGLPVSISRSACGGRKSSSSCGALAPDAMVVVGYGQIIPQRFSIIAPHGIINVHASLLPKYRGAAPIQWAIASGETRTGVTTMRIDAGLDTGDMLLKWETEIGPEETAVELGRAAGVRWGGSAGGDARRARRRIVPEKQDAAQATYAPILKKEDGLIDWRRPRRRFTIACAACSRGRARTPPSAGRRCTSGSRGGVTWAAGSLAAGESAGPDRAHPSRCW